MKKQNLLLTDPGGFMALPGPHSQVAEREMIEGESTWDSAFIRVKDWVLGFYRFILCW